MVRRIRSTIPVYTEVLYVISVSRQIIFLQCYISGSPLITQFKENCGYRILIQRFKWEVVSVNHVHLQNVNRILGLGCTICSECIGLEISFRPSKVALAGSSNNIVDLTLLGLMTVQKIQYLYHSL